MAIPEPDRTIFLISELGRGAQKAFENAEQLFREASLLQANGALSRALFLHQISMEECAKVASLGASAVSLLTGLEVHIEKVWRNLTGHKAKNYINAYMLSPTEQENEARERGDLKGSIEAFNKLQAAFHQESNTAKNASLYVDFKDGTFVAPRERITEAMVTALAVKNSEFLAVTYQQVNMLMHWKDNIGDAQASLTWYKTRLEKLRSEAPDSIEVALTSLIQERLESEVANRNRAETGREETGSQTK
jgi:AbiV family abortive infection protein